MTHLLVRDCSTCGEQRAFEAPACADGHGSDCPELACVGCGAAIFVGVLAAQLAGSPQSLPVVAPAA
jgi:hypothetical protein